MAVNLFFWQKKRLRMQQVKKYRRILWHYLIKMQKLIINSIYFYQRVLSFDTGLGRIFAIGDKTCRYSPTCSEYSKQAIEKYGILKGAFLGGKRFLSCHPYSVGGWDP